MTLDVKAGDLVLFGKGPSAFRGLRTPMEKLDEIVVGEVARQVLDPVRLTAMLDTYAQSTAAQVDGAWALLAKLRHDHTAAVAGIARLLDLGEKGKSASAPLRTKERTLGEVRPRLPQRTSPKRTLTASDRIFGL